LYFKGKNYLEIITESAGKGMPMDRRSGEYHLAASPTLAMQVTLLKPVQAMYLRPLEINIYFL